MDRRWAKYGAKSTVIDFVYKNAEGPRSGTFKETAVVQFCELDNGVMTFLPGVPRNVIIPVHRVEWKRGKSATFIRNQIPLILS